MKIFILGGGPAGLAVLDGLAGWEEAEIVLVEGQSQVGGLSQTISWTPHGRHDLGPHKIFTIQRDLWERVQNMLPKESWLTHPKVSRIFLNGHYLPYPPSVSSLLKAFGLKDFCVMGLDFMMARIKALFSRQVLASFEDDISHRVGRKLYQKLFRPISLKVLGDPKDLDSKFSQQRAQTPSLVEFVLGALGLRRSSQFEALEFYYPRGGLQNMWDAILRRVGPRATLLLDHRVLGFEVADRHVTAIQVKKGNSGNVQALKVSPDDFIISTLPLGIVARFFGAHLNPECGRLIHEHIQLNDLLLVFFKIKQPRLLKDCWISVPDPNIIFYRISEQAAFDPDMTPNGGIVCCEVMSYSKQPLWDKSDQEIIEMCREGIKTMGFDLSVIEDAKVIRLPKYYPVFRVGFQSALDRILGYLDEWKNFRSIGRQGAFQYISSLDAMDIGYGTAHWLRSRSHPDSFDSWMKERERTNYYPVLD